MVGLGLRAELGNICDNLLNTNSFLTFNPFLPLEHASNVSDVPNPLLLESVFTDFAFQKSLLLESVFLSQRRLIHECLYQILDIMAN